MNWKEAWKKAAKIHRKMDRDGSTLNVSAADQVEYLQAQVNDLQAANARVYQELADARTAQRAEVTRSAKALKQVAVLTDAAKQRAASSDAVAADQVILDLKR